MKSKLLALALSLSLVFTLGACGGSAGTAKESKAPAAQTEEKKAEPQKESQTAKEDTKADSTALRTLTDSKGRKVKVPAKVESMVCVGVGALRYSTYVGAADRAVGVEDYELKPGMTRLYQFVNFEHFKKLPAIGGNGKPNTEEIVKVNPQVIVLSAFAKVDPDELSSKTGIPVFVVPGSDTTLDQKAYDTIRLLGELYGLEKRAEELTTYLKGIQKDLDERTAKVADDKKPSVYVGGVAFKGWHGFEGTEAFYGPFELIHAKNLANTTGQKGAFDIDLEQVLQWDPQVIFLDFNGMKLIKEQYAKDPKYFQSLTAVKEGHVYSQISFRSSASNLETALADAYYGAKILYPETCGDIDIEAKTGEIFTKLLGSNPYPQLKEKGYAFRQIKLGEEK